MISEFTITVCQALAALFMGYDYFVSDKVKEVLDSKSKAFTEKLKDESVSEIKKILKHLKNNIIVIILGTAILVFAYFFYVEIENHYNKIDSIGFFIVGLIITIIIGIKGLNILIDKLLNEFVARMIVPSGKLMLSGYLLFSPKGVIAGLGMLFLVTSFIFRFINLYTS